MDRLRALIVDSDAILVVRLKATLANADFQVFGKRKGSEGLRLVLTEPFDLVLLGLELPDIDAAALLQRIHSHHPPINARIIAMTSRSDTDLLRKVFAFGVQGLLVKPFTMDALAERVQKLLPHIQLNFDLKDEFVPEAEKTIGSYGEIEGVHHFTMHSEGLRTAMNACFWFIRQLQEIGERHFTIDISDIQDMSPEDRKALDMAVQALRSRSQIKLITVADGHAESEESPKAIRPVNNGGQQVAPADLPPPKRFVVKTTPQHASRRPVDMPSGFLGVIPAPVPDDIRNDMDLAGPGGVFVQEVKPYSPAARFGVQIGDIIIAIDGKEVRSEEDIYDIMMKISPGNKVPVTVLRNDEPLVIETKLDSRKFYEDESDDTI